MRQGMKSDYTKPQKLGSKFPWKLVFTKITIRIDEPLIEIVVHQKLLSESVRLQALAGVFILENVFITQPVSGGFFGQKRLFYVFFSAWIY